MTHIYSVELSEAHSIEIDTTNGNLTLFSSGHSLSISLSEASILLDAMQHYINPFHAIRVGNDPLQLNVISNLEDKRDRLQSFINRIIERHLVECEHCCTVGYITIAELVTKIAECVQRNEGIAPYIHLYTDTDNISRHVYERLTPTYLAERK